MDKLEKEISTIVDSYIEALLFANDLNSVCDKDDLDSEDIKRITSNCIQFYERALERYTLGDIKRACLTSEDYLGQLGHDFYFTRHRHGVGFWEKSDWLEDVGSFLTKLSEDFCSGFDDYLVYNLRDAKGLN